MRRLSASVVLTLLALTSALPAEQATQPPTGLVAGRVVEASGHAPLRDVVVTIIGSLPQPGTGRPPVISVLSDVQGRFLFRGLAKGTYQITASVSGNGYTPNGFVVSGAGFSYGAYLNGGFGQRRPEGPLQAIDLAEGGRVDDAVIRMWKSAAITGHVLDETGEPLVAHVLGVVRVATDGRWLNGPTLRTDDRGAYRFGSLAPGRYVLFVPETQVSMPASVGDGIAAAPPDPLTAQRYSAASAPTPSLGGVRVGTSLVSTVQDSARFSAAAPISNAIPPTVRGQALFLYPTTFYPAATSPAEAGRIVLAAGDERQLDLRLRPAPAVSVSGRVVDRDGPVAGIGLHLMLGNGDDDGSILTAAMTASDANGQFVFPAVPGGPYRVVAFRDGNVPSNGPQPAGTVPDRVSDRAGAWANEPINVGHRAIEDLTVTVKPPAAVTGRVEFVGSASAPPVERLRTAFFTIPRASVIFRGNGGAFGARVDPDAGNRFVVRSVSPPGRYVVGAPTMPAPWVIESVTIAGRDVTDATFAVTESDIADVVVTYTDRPAIVSGNVAFAGVVADQTAVCLFPVDRTRWRDARLSRDTFRLVKPSAAGTFSVAAVPGDYFVMAIADELAGDWPDAAYLERLARFATTVRLGRGQTVTVALKPINVK